MGIKESNNKFPNSPIISMSPKSPIMAKSPNRPKSPDLEIIHGDIKGRDNDDRIDNESDRIYSDQLIGKKVMVNYENGWMTGTLQYFNTTLMEYNALLEDGTEDYMKECDIDGKDIKLIDEKSVKKKQNKPCPVPVIKTSS